MTNFTGACSENSIFSLPDQIYALPYCWRTYVEKVYNWFFIVITTVKWRLNSETT